MHGETVKLKAFLVHTKKAYMGSRDRAPLILNLDNGWR